MKQHYESIFEEVKGRLLVADNHTGLSRGCSPTNREHLTCSEHSHPSSSRPRRRSHSPVAGPPRATDSARRSRAPTRRPPQPAPKSNNQTRAGAKAALLEQFAAYQSGDARAAFATLSQACQQSVGLDEFSALFEEGLETVEDVIGSKLSEMELGGVEVLEFTPERAGLTSSLYLDGAPVYGEEEEDVSEWLVYEDGEWKGECPDDFEVEEHFEPVGEVIEDGTETTTTVTTVPPNWTAPSTTMSGQDDPLSVVREARNTPRGPRPRR